MYYIPNMHDIEVGPWKRKGGKGAVVHIDNAHMPNDLHVVEIRPGGKSEPEHHMYEEMVYILAGRGATSVWQDEKHKQTFEWAEGSLFAIPLNASYQHFNASGTEPARYIAVTNAPPMMPTGRVIVQSSGITKKLFTNVTITDDNIFL